MTDVQQDQKSVSTTEAPTRRKRTDAEIEAYFQERVILGKVEQRNKLEWERSVGAVILDMLPELRHVILEAGDKLAEQNRAGMGHDSHHAEAYGAHIMNGLAEWWTRSHFEPELWRGIDLHPAMHPAQMTEQHVRDWFGLDCEPGARVSNSPESAVSS